MTKIETKKQIIFDKEVRLKITKVKIVEGLLPAGSRVKGNYWGSIPPTLPPLAYSYQCTGDMKL